MMDKEIKKEFERLQKGFSKPTNDTDGKESFGIGFWKALEVVKKLSIAPVSLDERGESTVCERPYCRNVTTKGNVCNHHHNKE